MKKVLIIGGAGYVGKFVVELFSKASNFSVHVLCHGNGSFLLTNFNVQVLNSKNISNDNQYDIIINLAYPTGVTPLKYSIINNQIIQMIKQNLRPTGKIIHASSLAVFGYPLDFPVKPDSVKKRFDLPYVMTKIEMENLLLKYFSKNELHIVRLGNVWGPASPFWTFALADKLFFGEPVLVKNKDGFSNLTDVVNVADYFFFLANKKYNKSINFHHLAEFSYMKWSEVVVSLEALLKENIVFIDTFDSSNTNLRKEIFAIVKSMFVLPKKDFVLNTRFLSGFLWNFLSYLPVSLINLLKRFVKKKSKNVQDVSVNIDPNFFSIITCNKQFDRITDPEWTPPIDYNTSLKNVSLWLKRVGY